MASVSDSFSDLVMSEGKVYTRASDGKDDEIDLTTLNDSNKLIDFIIDNMGKGIGNDAKMILKRKLRGGDSSKTTSNSDKPKGL